MGERKPLLAGIGGHGDVDLDRPWIVTIGGMATALEAREVEHAGRLAYLIAAESGRPYPTPGRSVRRLSCRRRCGRSSRAALISAAGDPRVITIRVSQLGFPDPPDTSDGAGGHDVVHADRCTERYRGECDGGYLGTCGDAGTVPDDPGVTAEPEPGFAGMIGFGSGLGGRASADESLAIARVCLRDDHAPAPDGGEGPGAG